MVHWQIGTFAHFGLSFTLFAPIAYSTTHESWLWLLCLIKIMSITGSVAWMSAPNRANNGFEYDWTECRQFGELSAKPAKVGRLENHYHPRSVCHQTSNPRFRWKSYKRKFSRCPRIPLLSLIVINCRDLRQKQLIFGSDLGFVLIMHIMWHWPKVLFSQTSVQPFDGSVIGITKEMAIASIATHVTSHTVKDGHTLMWSSISSTLVISSLMYYKS